MPTNRNDVGTAREERAFAHPTKSGGSAGQSQSRTRHCEEPLRRSNPDCLYGKTLDCFAPLAMTMGRDRHSSNGSP
ncbi:hypothetical protein GPL17_11985 [Bradyrhizobium yuanmingense]|nr:hypothetical protein [Bradyrhizobium yuanmingense]